MADSKARPAASLGPDANEADSFVFLDARGKRWPRLRLLMFAVGILFFVGVTLFAQTLFIPSQLKLPAAVQQLKTRLKALQGSERSWQRIVPKPLWLNFAKTNSGAPGKSGDGTGTGSAGDVRREYGPGFPEGTEIHLGFFENWDPNSLDSLKAHVDTLTHLCPDWISLVDGRGTLKIAKDQVVLDLLKGRGIVLLPMLSNLASGGSWSADAVEGLIHGPADRQQQFIANLTAQLHAMGAGGVVIDWEQVDPTYRATMTDFLITVATALHDQDLEVWLCVPMGSELDIFDLDALAQHIDRFVAMLHDENAESDPPGPIASWKWYNGWLDTLVEDYGEPSQWVIGLGSYGYDWADGEKEAATISFPDVMSRAHRAELTSCEFDAPTYNPHFFYEDAGVAHTVWFLDAVTFLNQLREGRERHVGGVAISRLGTEDPAIWGMLAQDTARPLSPEGLTLLENIRPGEAIAHVDRGNFLTMEDERADGKRQIGSDESADPEAVTTEQYEKFPGYRTIVHQGGGTKDAVAITFDDGPDAEWTPRILDILQEKGVRATFFLIGANIEKDPGLAKRIVREGHMIGVHTYTHPNVALVSEERAYLEFNATQRLIEAVTGHSTTLFRPPYNADTNPHDPEELVPISLAQRLGYITVGEDIDTEDWAKPGVAAMLEYVKEGRQLGGSIVLLHDAGGDRSQTIAALPKIIDYLRLRGDTILPLPEMLGVAADQLMPPVQRNQRSVGRLVSEWGFTLIHALADFFWAFMIVATGLVVLRTLVIASLAMRNRRHDSNAPGAADFSPPVSVLIAAYNEAKVIEGTLRALLAADYPGEIEVVVVDDGSHDSTAAIVAGMAQGDRRLRLLRQVNSGKATALRFGLAALRHEIVVCLDADTQFEANTIRELVRPLIDPTVGAVSGRARVGNPKTMIARFQSLEYTCGFNLDRRAYHQPNCITVVPGAVSAFRKSAVAAAGGISTETLAEDTDLTLSLHECRYRICYAARAVAWTEAPETIRAFAKQRFRWAFGTLQCLWKHRDLLFDAQYGALGCFSLPSAWFFNILLVAIGPVIDGVLLCSLIVSPANAILYFYFAVFLCADLLLAAVACRIEGEPLAQIRLVVPMRFIYRPVLSFAVAKAIFKAVKGVWVGWGKLDRTASVSYDSVTNKGQR